ncbi:uncharacterized mitochondrial protein AtMg00810-like [Vicia villosa]|uniref:uncharacterized mitochondrial protein AtMg00810-like n=1 Tax=Vicia villosa TaxID=3911 RepID=UPI00273CA18D|nr:uncharacterized mitochondrial protein AtMg00810-like [Vicia villosa]
MSDLGIVTYFLGIKLHKSEKGLLMHQRRYALEILKKCDEEHCNVVITPAESRLQLSKNEEEQNVDPTQYRRLIRSLRYLCNTRPDLAFSADIATRVLGLRCHLDLEDDQMQICSSFDFSAPISEARVRPIKALYFAYFLVVWNSKYEDTSTTSITSLSKMSPTPLPLVSGDQSVKTIHIVHLSM